jgi:23S rRNA pseudouridine955/2504/2580 synthase
VTGQIVNETVAAEEDGTRLDRWIKRRVPVSQGEIEKWLRTGQVRVDGRRAKANHRLATGEEVRLPIFADRAERPARSSGRDITVGDAEFIRGLIIHEDDDLIVLNKPAGLAVQGGTGQGRHIDGLLDVISREDYRASLVHRLDKETSGLLLIARHPKAAATLSEMFRGREIEKVYWAVTVGVPSPPAGQIRCWMVKGIADAGAPEGYRLSYERGMRDGDRERMFRAAQNVEGARHAITDYTVVSKSAQKAAWVAMRPHTGRMHQLRFHMLELNTSILGDAKYKSRREVPQGLAKGLHLHARALIIPRIHGKPLTVTAPLPPHMAETFATLGFLEEEAGRDPLAPFA